MIEGRKPQLTVNCLGQVDVDRGQLTNQLNSLLSSSLTYGHVTSLSITNTPLTQVPRSVCRLTTLIQLHLDNNRLTRLPDNCFTNLTALMSLSATRNSISELQDGLLTVFTNWKHSHIISWVKSVQWFCYVNQA